MAANPESAGGAEDESIDLYKLWLVLWRNKWALITLPLLVAMLTYLYNSTLIPVYRASSTLLIEPDSGNVVGIQGIDGTGRNREYLQTQFELLKSRALAENVVEKLDLAQHEIFDRDAESEPLIDWRSLLEWRRWVEMLGLESLIATQAPDDFQPTPAEVEQNAFDRAVGAVRR